MGKQLGDRQSENSDATAGELAPCKRVGRQPACCSVGADRTASQSPADKGYRCPNNASMQNDTLTQQEQVPRLGTLEHLVGALSIRQFCKLTGLGRTTVYAQIKSGGIQVKKVGRRTLIPVSTAAAWLER